MPNRMHRAAMAALLPLVFCFASAVPGFAGAQSAAPDPRVQITPAQAATFFSAFTALAQQAHVALVAEDQPLHPALMPQEAAGLELNPNGEPLSTLLPRLAAAYDYDVQPSGRVFLLKKRYTDAADLPSVTAKECALGLEEAGRYAENFNPNFPNDEIDNSPAIKDLVYSLTPEQLGAMADNKGGVPVASLAPVQQQEVQQLVMHFYVQRAIKDLPTVLGTISRGPADPQFGWHYFPQMSARLFGYDAPLAYQGFQILSKPNQVEVHPGGGLVIHPVAGEGEPPPTPATMMQLTAAPDATDPDPVQANALQPAPPVSSSLAELVTRLNARADDGLKVTVEPYLAPKRATIFGAEAATPRQELAALAEVYGLRVFTGDKEGGHDRLRLTRRTAGVPLNLIALHDSILQALPDPLVRAYRLHNRFAPAGPASPFPSGLSPLLVSAVKQIRTAAEPKVKSRDGRIALSALSEQEGRAFAVTLMVDALDALGSWVEATPPETITRFNDLRLGAGCMRGTARSRWI